MGRLFGTDGVRGVANTELTCELSMQIGRAAAMVLTKHTIGRPKILIAKDTRISSDMIESALVAGLSSVGADVEILGVLPTPAVAYLVTKYEANAGIMISASHNTVEYNGIKLFSDTGFKLSDEIEDEIEALILDTPEKITLKQGIELGRVFRRKSAISDYVDYIKRTIDIDLSGINIALDCANGSASATADLLFRELGASPHIIHSHPNGMNINDKCGSTNLNSLIYYMSQNNCDIGFAFDGDADRCLAVDENGKLVSGDQIIAIMSKYMKAKGTLNKNTAVTTVMSNFGMQKFSQDNDITFIQTSVGDRYVLEEMIKNEYNLGGEDSGHIILKDYSKTGDGQLTAIHLLQIYKEQGVSMSELSKTMTKSPQVLRSVEASATARAEYMQDSVISETITDAERELENSGRILVRASGTEPIIRVMIEGHDASQINRLCDKVCEVIAQRTKNIT